MPTYDLGLEHVSLAFATKNIFTDVTQGVFEGDRIGIVGKNGDGKSTLLHLFKGCSAASAWTRKSARCPAVSAAAPTLPACCSRTGTFSRLTSPRTIWTW